MLMRKLLRELRMNAGQFLSIFIMVFLAAFAFAGIHAYMDGMRESAERYYEKNNLEDLWMAGEHFTREDQEAVRAVPNVRDAQRLLSVQCTWKREEGEVAVEANFIESDAISRFHVFEGEPFDAGKHGLWLDYYLARKLGVQVGEEIPLSWGEYVLKERVNGLIGTPDHVYAVKDQNVIFPDHQSFGFAYLSIGEFPKEYLLVQALKSGKLFAVLSPGADLSEYYPFPQMLVDVEDTSRLEQTKAKVEQACGGILAVTDRKLNVSWAAYQSEIEEGQTYSAVFTAMFLFIALLSVVTTMNRFVKKQRTQIGTLKALGFCRTRIIRHYVGFGFVTGLAGVMLGTVIGAATFGVFMLREQMTIFLVPDYVISLRPVIFLAGAGILAAITLITWLSCRKILKEPAAQALRVEQPSVRVRPARLPGRRLLQRASFSTKWNLRDIGRNRARSLMAVAGIAGSCMLIVTAFGMLDTMRNYTKWQFGGILNFDWKLTLKEDITKEQLAAIEKQFGDATSQTVGVEFVGGDGKTQINALTVHDAPGVLRLSAHDRSLFEMEKDGIYLTEKLADTAGLSVGDMLRWRILGEEEWKESLIIGLNRDPQNQQLNMHRAGLEALGAAYRPDTLYIGKAAETSLADISSGSAALPLGVEMVSSLSDLEGQVGSMLAIMYVMLGVLIFASALLGFVIIYNLGILALSEKNYQFATLKVLGFRSRSIRKIFITQNLWLTAVSVLLGLPGGYALTDYIFREAIGEKYDFFAMINARTYLYALGGTLLISWLSSSYLARRLRRIDMVSSLKANE